MMVPGRPPLVLASLAGISVAVPGALGGAYLGTLSAWIPAPEGGALIRVPVPGAFVAIEGLDPVATDGAGRFALDGGAGPRALQASLSGPGVAIVSEAGIELRIRAAIGPGVPARIEFPREWAAASAAFVHAEEARRRLAGLDLDPPVPHPPLPIRIVFGRGAPCAMGYDPSTGEIFFPAPSPACPLPTERTIVLHEVAHAFLAEIYGILAPLDLQEGLADAAAARAAGSPWIGRGARGPGTFLREVESDAIHPVAGNAHDRGLALAGALWDLRTRLLHAGLRDAGDRALRLWYEAARSLPRALGPQLGRSILEANARIRAADERAIREVLSAHGLLDPPLPPPVVRGLRAAVEGRVVRLAWQVDRGGTIRIERDGSRLAAFDAAAGAFADSVPAAGSYTYLIEAEEGADPPAVAWVDVRTFRRGDVDDDGAIDVRDAILVLEALFRGGEIRCPDAADVDDDGLVRINDPVALLLALFGEGPPPPPPRSAWGDDPTADGLGCGPP